jgi:hypothetical protein
MNNKLSNTRNVLVIETPIVITPDQVQTYSPDGTGGGYTPHGFNWGSTINGSGWGADMQHPKGIGGKGTIHNLATPNVMSEFMGEQEHNQSVIDAQYNSRFSTIVGEIEREMEEHKAAARFGQNFTPSESLANDQNTTFNLIDTKKREASALSSKARAMRGLSPYFLMNHLPRQMMAEFINSRKGTPEELGKLYHVFDDAYSSALEIKALSISEKILSDKLIDIATQKEQADIEAAGNLSVAAQDHRLSIIKRERDIYTQQLPRFLQAELANEAGHANGMSLSQALLHYKGTLDRMAATKLGEVKPVQAPPPYSSGGVTLKFPAENPKIKPPLSKPELEALNELVYLQNNTAIGVKWLSYHDALLKTESSFHLQRASQKFSALAERANDSEQTIDAIKFTLDFYSSAGEKFGEKTSVLASALAESVKGKTIRSAEQAIKAYDTHKNILEKKFSSQDKQAIANALASLDQQMMASTLNKFGKSLGFAGLAIDGMELATDAKKSVESGNWTPFFIKAETLVAGKAAGILIGLVFGISMATPMGILGFALMMAVTSFLIDEEVITQVNNYLTDS